MKKVWTEEEKHMEKILRKINKQNIRRGEKYEKL